MSIVRDLYLQHCLLLQLLGARDARQYVESRCLASSCSTADVFRWPSASASTSFPTARSTDCLPARNCGWFCPIRVLNPTNTNESLLNDICAIGWNRGTTNTSPSFTRKTELLHDDDREPWPSSPPPPGSPHSCLSSWPWRPPLLLLFFLLSADDGLLLGQTVCTMPSPSVTMVISVAFGFQ
jgi:hypothetical protein